MNKEYQPIIEFIQEFYNKYNEENIDLMKKPEITFYELGLDSMSFIEFLVLAEEKFRISIDSSDLPKEHTVGDYAKMIYEKSRGNSND